MSPPFLAIVLKRSTEAVIEMLIKIMIYQMITLKPQSSYPYENKDVLRAFLYKK